MTVAQHKIELAQKVLQTDDKNILKTIELLFSQENELIELSTAQKKEIDKRLHEIENGNATFYSIGEVKKIVRKNHKLLKK